MQIQKQTNIIINKSSQEDVNVFFIIWFFNNRIIYKLAAQISQFFKRFMYNCLSSIANNIKGFWAVFKNFYNLTFIELNSWQKNKILNFLRFRIYLFLILKSLESEGAGGNVVTQMAEENLDQVETIICNTDIKALKRNKSHKKIELGRKLTRGMGAGARQEVGEGAAEESLSEISEAVDGANMVFIAAGMGGGTGTGATPTIARMAMEKQILTVGIVTIPFSFEGTKRRESGLAGVERLREFTDTLLVIPNDKLLDASTQNTSFLEAFHMVDMVLINAIRGITFFSAALGISTLTLRMCRPL